MLTDAVLTKASPAERGSDVLIVDSTTALTPGNTVLLQVDNTLADYRLLKEIAGNIEGASTYDWAKAAATLASGDRANFQFFEWPVVIAEIITERQVRIEQPLPLSIHRSTPARLLSLAPTVHDSGVEDLTIENKVLVQTVHNNNPGSNGVGFFAVHDCWARNIRVLNADVAFGMTAAKSCTLTGIRAGGRSLHHFVACRVHSHDNLIEDFLLEEPTIPAARGSYMHGLNIEGFASGNVYRRGVMRVGTFDTHRALPFAALRTNIILTNKDGVNGGNFAAGPFFGARCVHWGITVTNNANVGVEISDIAPRSLTAGIFGLTQPGSGGYARVPNGAYTGDLESERLAFGTDLTTGRDLLDLQRRRTDLPVHAVQVAAETKLKKGDVEILLTARNDEDEPVTITFKTPWGEKTVKNLQPGKTADQSLNIGSANVPMPGAVAVVVTSSGNETKKQYTTIHAAHYEAIG